jgi:hypothetical protein
MLSFFGKDAIARFKQDEGMELRHPIDRVHMNQQHKLILIWVILASHSRYTVWCSSVNPEYLMVLNL